MVVSEKTPLRSGRTRVVVTVSRQETVKGTDEDANAEDNVLPDAE